MEKESIKCNLKKLIIQIVIPFDLMLLVILLIYFDVWNINEYRLIIAASIGYMIYLLYKDVVLLINYKKPIIELDSEGILDYDSIYGKIYWNNIESVSCVTIYPFLILYKETVVVLHLKNKRAEMNNLKNKKIAEKALMNSTVRINTSKIDINAIDLQKKILDYKKRFINN